MTDYTIVTDNKLKEAYLIMARVIRDHGDTYLPIFKRLKDEIDQRRARKEPTEFALQLAENSGQE